MPRGEPWEGGTRRQPGRLPDAETTPREPRRQGGWGVCRLHALFRCGAAVMGSFLLRLGRLRLPPRPRVQSQSLRVPHGSQVVNGAAGVPFTTWRGAVFEGVDTWFSFSRKCDIYRARLVVGPVGCVDKPGESLVGRGLSKPCGQPWLQGWAFLSTGWRCPPASSLFGAVFAEEIGDFFSPTL